MTRLPTSSAVVLAVVSGKGGTGKSTIAVNLSERLAGLGYATGLLDADVGQTSCATLLNERPAATAAALAAGAVPPEALPHRTAGGVSLVTAGDGRPPDSPDAPLFGALDAALGTLERTHDVVLIDAPAGVGPVVRWALDRADAGLLVLVGEPAAVTGAFALAKAVWAVVPEYPLLTVVNAADTNAEAAETAARFSALTEQFLGAAPGALGWLPYSAHVRAGAWAQTPAVRMSPAVCAAVDGLAASIVPLLPRPRRLALAA